MKKKLVIIDGKSVFYRGYYAMRNLSLSDGTPTGGVYGFAAMMLEIVKKLEPDYLAVAWDKAKTNIEKRREIYAEYKANRKAAPEDFYTQIPYLMELLAAFDVPLYEYDGFEADDIMGSLAKQAANEGLEVVLVSGDLDMLQIVDKDIEMYQMRKGFSDIVRFDVAAIEKKYGLRKDQFLDLKAIKGVASDNIPGVAGIGEKGAIKLLQEWESLDGVYAHLDQIKGAMADKLLRSKKMAYVSRDLSEIMFDAPITLNLTELTTANMDKDKIIEALSKLEFKSLIAKVSKEKQGSAPAIEEKNDNRAELMVDKNFEKPIADDLCLSWNVKQAMHDDDSFAKDILAGAPFWDLGQGEFLLDPLIRKNKQLSLIKDNNDVLAQNYWRQQEAFSKRSKLKWVAENLDFPLVPILYRIEKKGIKIDVAKFATLREKFSKEITSIEQKIYTLAGKEFNIGSPMQLAQVLYEELNLPTKGVKKKQRFYSTGQKELDKLHDLHAIIPEIERIRELTKLLNTYVCPLPALADEEGRIHTTYTQDITATGRLSSLTPNLQNIPVRKKEGRWIRDCFVAGEGKIFVSADYAQFELRLAAVLAGDKQLIDDFNAAIDIHTKTASSVFKIPMEEVSSEQRRAAKVINFGVLYGMSAKGLADATGMSISAAKEFIDKYFELRKPIREYLDKTLNLAREEGYVETVFGRRRPTPDIQSANYRIRTAAERAAMNMPIQGTEADLMKIAMIRIANRLMEGAELVLQVHDSLVIECDEAKAETVAGLLKDSMEGVCPQLAIKLAVDVSSGKTWGDL